MTIRTSLPALAAAAALAAAVPAQAQDLIYSTITPETFFANVKVLPPFIEHVQQGTGGGQSIEIHAGGVLTGDTAVIEAISERIVDAGTTAYSFTPSLVPTLLLVSDLPGQNPQVSAAASTETILLDCPQCEAEAEKVGIYPLTADSSESFSMLCNDVQIASLDDAEGVKIRAVGAFGRIAAFLGMTPVNVVYTEIYNALQRGQAECAIIGANNLKSMQLWDVVDNVSDLSMGTSHGWSLMILNRDMWFDEFSPETRRVWIDGAAGIVSDNVRYSLEAMNETLQEATADRGITITEASDELRASLEAAFEAQTEAAISSARERGVEDAEAIAEAYFENVEKWMAIYEEIGGDGTWGDAEWEAFEARIKTEIYDRIASE